MPLDPDDEICFCFHVTLRKVAAFCRIDKPKVASQISQCLSAGTGCGWCRPMLRKLHKQFCPDAQPPWWRAIPDPPPDPADPVTDYRSQDRDADPAQLDPDAYAAARQQYLKDTGRKPPTA